MINSIKIFLNDYSFLLTVHKDGISNKLIIWYDIHNINKDRLMAYASIV